MYCIFVLYRTEKVVDYLYISFCGHWVRIVVSFSLFFILCMNIIISLQFVIMCVMCLMRILNV